jgi:hypothetical protein
MAVAAPHARALAHLSQAAAAVLAARAALQAHLEILNLVVHMAVVLAQPYQMLDRAGVVQSVSCGPVTPAHSHQLVQAHLNF